MYETVNRLPLASDPVTTLNDQDFAIEILLPDVDLSNVAVHIAPHPFLISSDIDEAGLQICQLIDLPYNVPMDGVDAEQSSNLIRITAALA